MSVTINHKRPLHLFEGYGVEIEYAIVNCDTLDIIPIADKVLEHQAGRIVNEVEVESLAWSNELVLHVIELKTNGAATELYGLGAAFQTQVEGINNILEKDNACLMPGAIHPWMNPFNGVELWPHDYNPIYEAYNRIFNCSGHGWSNLQSTHLNLPFFGDDEFEKLHAALRIVLPLIPSIATSSPIADSVRKPFHNYRMEMYRTNSIKIPSITGLIVPEAIFSRQEYQNEILERMYRDIEPHDPDKILQDEWLNSRGLMPRWDRHTIEVRVIDNQECPAADLAILEWVVALAKSLVNEETCTLAEQKEWHEEELYPILMQTIKEGEEAVISNERYLKMFGLNRSSIKAGQLCSHIFSRLKSDLYFSKDAEEHLDLIFREGTLATRILKSLPGSFQKDDLLKTYQQLCDCLRRGKAFIP